MVKNYRIFSVGVFLIGLLMAISVVITSRRDDLAAFLISLLVMGGSFGTWIYSQSAELTSIKRDISFQEKQGDEKAIKKDIQYMNESLKEIKTLLKELHKCNR